MSNEFSIDKLFTQGIQKDKFIENYLNGTKNMSEEDEVSIFGNKLSGVIGEIFEVADKNKDGQIDENEITLLKQLSNDNDNNESITKNVLSEVIKRTYQDIKSKYQDFNPETMYNQNMTGEIISSTYIQTLSEQIEMVENMIMSKEIDSQKVIQQYENEINDLIQNSNNLTKQFKKEYAKTKKEAEKTQKLITENKLALEKAQQELNDNTEECTVIENEINQYNQDDENDKPNIEDCQNQLKKLQKTNKGISSNISKYSSNISEYSAKYSKLQSKLSSMQQEAMDNDATIKNEIANKKTQINIERQNTTNTVNEYKTTLNKLNEAKTYALKRLLAESVRNQEEFSFEGTNDGRNVAALKDVNYNKEKGQELASYMKQHAKGFTGYCARYTKRGLQATGLTNGYLSGNAKDIDNQLRNNKNFKEIKVNSAEELRNLPAGCVIVYEAGAAGYNSQYGHIEVALGNGTAASDGITRNMRYAKNMSVFVPV